MSNIILSILILISFSSQAEDLFKGSLIKANDFKKFYPIFTSKKLFPQRGGGYQIEDFFKKNPNKLKTIIRSTNKELKKLGLPQLDENSTKVYSQYIIGFGGPISYQGILLSDGLIHFCFPCVAGGSSRYGFYLGDSQDFSKLEKSPCKKNLLGFKNNYKQLQKLYLNSFKNRLISVWEISIKGQKLPFKIKSFNKNQNSLTLALCGSEFTLNRLDPIKSKCLLDLTGILTNLQFQKSSGCFVGITSTTIDIKICTNGRDITFQYGDENHQRIENISENYHSYLLTNGIINKKLND